MRASGDSRCVGVFAGSEGGTNIGKRGEDITTANPLTEQKVEQLILTFWKMQEEKARVVELMEITAPDLEISMGDFAWRGYKGLEDHQMGSKAQFFDQKFKPRSISVKMSGEEATVTSEVQWHARHWAFPAAKSQEIKAIYNHTWIVRRSPSTGKPVVVLNHVDHMRYVDGFEPPEAQHNVDPHLAGEL